MRENDPFATFDAAYVLGALSPDDRQAFEAHLPECPECARSVQDLAGLPGLLAQVTADPVECEPLPERLLSSALKQVRRSRRRRLVLTVGAVAAAVAACLALFIPSGPTDGSTAGTPGTTMTALGNFPVKADIGLQDQTWGTRVSMSCSYRGGWSGDYVLVAVGRGGDVSELASWRANAQDTARIVVGTSLHRRDIQALEVRTRAGLAILRLST